MPAGVRVKPEAVARGWCGADAPARGRRAGFERCRRPDEKKRPAAIAGGELQLLAQFQLEPVDHAGDRKRCRRTQCFGKCPQRVFAVRRLDQDEVRRIKAEAVQPVSGQPAMAAPAIGGKNKDEGQLIYLLPLPIRAALARAPGGGRYQLTLRG